MSNNIQPPDNGITPEHIQLSGRWKSGAMVRNTYEVRNTNEAGTDQAGTNEFPELASFQADKLPF